MTSQIIRYCLEGGLLVDGTYRVPTDPREYHGDSPHIHAGCSHIRCPICGEAVRRGPTGLVPAGDLAVHRADLIGSADWRDRDYLIQSPGSAVLYTCRCRSWVENGLTGLDDPDPDPGMTPSLPWRCAGHPAPELPFALGNLTVSHPTELDLLIDSVMAGWSPIAGDHDAGPAQWLVWLDIYLAESELEGRLSQILASRYADGLHVQDRGRVLYFFSQRPSRPGFHALLEGAERDASLVATSYPIPDGGGYSPCLLDMLVARLKARTTRVDESGHDLDVRTAAVFRQALTLPLDGLPHDDAGPSFELAAFRAQLEAKGGPWTPLRQELLDDWARMLEGKKTDRPTQALEDPELIRALNEDDVAWLSEHVLDADAAAPGRWQAVLSALRYQASWNHDLQHYLVIAIGRLAHDDSVPNDEVETWVDAHARAYDAWVLPARGLLSGDPPE